MRTSSILRRSRACLRSVRPAFGKQNGAAAASVPRTAGLFSLRAMTADAVVIHVTAPDHKVAKAIAGKLVEEKLAACVQTITGVESTYWWDGKVETSKEELLLIKTSRALTQKVSDFVSQLHPYDVPEIIATPIEGGSAAYLKWLQEAIQRAN